METSDLQVFARSVLPGDVVMSPRVGGVCDLPPGAVNEVCPFKVFDEVLGAVGVPCFSEDGWVIAACVRNQGGATNGGGEDDGRRTEEKEGGIIVATGADFWNTRRLVSALRKPPGDLP